MTAAARDYQAEETAREFAGWYEAQAYPSHVVNRDDLADAFAAGMQAARDLDAAQEPHAATELDGLRKALHAISLGIAEPSPKSVAEDALNGRYFDPMKDSGVWRTSDLGTAWRLLDEARAGLRELTKRVKALAGEWVESAEHDEARVRPTVIGDARARTLRECADELRKRAGLPA